VFILNYKFSFNISFPVRFRRPVYLVLVFVLDCYEPDHVSDGKKYKKNRNERGLFLFRNFFVRFHP
jgi:hypothetical protein